MNNKDLFNLLDNIQEEGETSTPKPNDKVLLIDGLNLFFRNFAMMNMVNPDGVHIGGLGGFLRSLGALIRQTEPTSVYIIFDGVGSSNNRKNVIPEYKSGRNVQRITNWEIFDDLDDEHNSKIDQIVRLIQYLKTLPVKTISIDKVEADDVISVLANNLANKHNSKVLITSSDKDFLQLASDNITVYRPMEKEFYSPPTVKSKFGVLTSNFILYKTLLGDSSDKVDGVKGLGPKKIFKLFPELQTETLTLDNIFEISSRKIKDHLIYSRIVQDQNRLRNTYKIMDLSNPMIDEKEIEYLNNLINSPLPGFYPEHFMGLYEEDKLGGMIRNLDIWLRDNFLKFTSYNDVK